MPNNIHYRDYIDNTHILLVDDDRTYALIDKMFAAMAEKYTSRTINIGMDEAFLLGVGKFLEQHGYEKRMDIMLRHLSKVLAIADKYGFTCEIWSDMFFRLINGGSYDAPGCKVPEDITDKIPKNVRLVYWNYLSTDYDHVHRVINLHKKLTNNIGFAGGLWKWMGYAADNTFSASIAKNAVRASADCGLDYFVQTLWADNGGESSLFSILPSLFACAQYAKGCDNPDKAEFKKITGVGYDDFLVLDRLNNPHGKDLKTLNNRHYYYLFNDVLLGNFDSLLSEGTSAGYADAAQKIEALDGGEYDYLFKNMAALARVLSIKAELGKRIKAAYDGGDKSMLQTLATDDIPRLIRYIEAFGKTFRAQWYRENKGFGYEVPCIRQGGLIYRLQFVAQLITDYASGKIAKIDELEGERLPFAYESHVTEDTYIMMNYVLTVTNGFI